MTKNTHLTILALLLAFGTGLAQIPYNSRYTKPIFDEITVTLNVVYGNAPALNFPYLDESNTSPQDLLLDIYEPVGDELEYRPAIICAHSGAFISGSKGADDMVAFCDSLAHRGYVTASIDYRLGMNALSSESSTRAVYRGIQDGRAAVRFFKENAELYGIDTSNIYLLGSSAGAYIGQHNYYMDTEDERPPETYDNPDLGCLDCAGNDFEHLGKANGIVALWGALMDTTLIISNDTLPIFMAHGTADATVPFGYGSAFGNDNFPATYGSSLVAEQLDRFDNSAQTFFVFGAGHEFYGTSNGNWSGSPNMYWDSIFNKTEQFYYDVQKPKAGFAIVQMENVAIFTDTSSFSTSWYWDFGDGYYSTEQNPIHEYETPGEFTVIQFVSNNLDSWDTTSAYALSTVGIKENTAIEISIHPVPASQKITITNAEIKPLKIVLIDKTGKALIRFEIKELQMREIDISSFAKGLYFVIADDGYSKVFKKLIIL